MIPVYDILFYCFSALLLCAAVMVIFSKNSVHAILFLVLAFVAASMLWISLQAEFLGLVLIFVYVGAVMTLFLFVVMMLNVDLSRVKEGFVRYLPFGLILLVLFVATMSIALHFSHLSNKGLLFKPSHWSSLSSLGTLLFTRYLFAFEVAAAVLLVAMISAICLAFYGRKKGTKSQKISEQLRVKPADRLRIVKDLGAKHHD